VLIAILQFVRRRLFRRRCGILGATASLLILVYLELPLIEQAALSEARVMTSALITAEQRQLDRLKLFAPEHATAHAHPPRRGAP
jgi:hypothetical protein